MNEWIKKGEGKKILQDMRENLGKINEAITAAQKEIKKELLVWITPKDLLSNSEMAEKSADEIFKKRR